MNSFLKLTKAQDAGSLQYIKRGYLPIQIVSFEA